MPAAKLAADVRRHYGVRGCLSDDDLDRILAGNLITVVEFPFSGRLREMCYGRHILLRPGLSHELRRWLKCHALYHVLNGLASHAYLDQWNPVLRRRDEHQAEAFAGHLLIGRHPPSFPPWDIAAEYDVPQDRVERWLSIAPPHIAKANMIRWA